MQKILEKRGSKKIRYLVSKKILPPCYRKKIKEEEITFQKFVADTAKYLQHLS